MKKTIIFILVLLIILVSCTEKRVSNTNCPPVQDKKLVSSREMPPITLLHSNDAADAVNRRNQLGEVGGGIRCVDPDGVDIFTPAIVRVDEVYRGQTNSEYFPDRCSYNPSQSIAKVDVWSRQGIVEIYCSAYYDYEENKYYPDISVPYALNARCPEGFVCGYPNLQQASEGGTTVSTSDLDKIKDKAAACVPIKEPETSSLPQDNGAETTRPKSRY